MKNYNLGSLWLFLEYKDKGFSDYAKKVSEFGLTLVSAVDKSNSYDNKDQILSYFKGELENPDSLDNDKSFQLKANKLKKPNIALIEGHAKKKVFKEEDLKDIHEMTKHEKEKDLIRTCEFLTRIERPIDTKSKALRNSIKSFKFTLDFIEKLRDENKQINPKEDSQSNKKSVLDEISKSIKGFETKLRAIIIVPTIKIPGNVSLSNIKELLVDGKYKDHTQEDIQIPGKVEIAHAIEGKNIIFEFRSDVQNFKEENWNQVVACFLSGISNEYLSWPNGDKPAVLFGKSKEFNKEVKGFFLKYHELPAESRIKNINVTVVDIHRYHRYKDYNSKNKIWSTLESFLQSKTL